MKLVQLLWLENVQMESESHCCPGIQIVEHVLQPQLFPFLKINAKGENLYFCLMSKKNVFFFVGKKCSL